MNHDPKTLKVILERTAPDIELTFRPMFGGILAYIAGKPAASLSDRGLALKVAPADRDALIAAGGAALRYEDHSPPSKSYTLVPDAWLDAAETLRPWIERCTTFAASAPLRARKR